MMGVGGVWSMAFTSRESDFSIAYWEGGVCDGVTVEGIIANYRYSTYILFPRNCYNYT